MDTCTRKKALLRTCDELQKGRLIWRNKMIREELKLNDPVKKQVANDLSLKGILPMDPPDPYSHHSVAEIPVEQMSYSMKELINEHSIFKQVTENYESALHKWYNQNYIFDDEINEKFKEFFTFLDVNSPQHNAKEEKILFPMLKLKLIENGEHNQINESRTAVDILEDEHIKISQAVSVVFNFLGLGSRLAHQPSREMVFLHTYEQGLRTVETIKLHIYMEEKTIFPLAMKLFSQEELDKIDARFKSHK